MAARTIMLGVSGSIAAYKAVDILRRLRETGAAVRVVMTSHATQFVSRLTFEALSGQAVLTDEFLDWSRGGIGHIEVSAGLDAAVVAPATANIIGKAAAGIADDALSSALLALDCPLIMAPAMNDRMYRNPAVQSNMSLLRERGVRFVEPDRGPLACGTEGLGRLAATERIVQEVLSAVTMRDLAGVTVLVTAGPTREPIDAVRFISNPSTGKMGYALAAAARDRGARVVLVSGPTQIAPPQGVEVVPVASADEMRRAVMDRAPEAAAVIMAAAVSDFRPVEATERKIKKNEAPDTVRLERTADILAELGASNGRRLLVGFAAETDSVREQALKKLRQKNLDLIVVNDISREGAGFGSDTNIVTLFDREGNATEPPQMTKRELAAIIIDKAAELMKKKGLLP
jgi:phosphopantothenoylcysteine decarboxylase/phosphopantothenate--cysteine ligase